MHLGGLTPWVMEKPLETLLVEQMTISLLEEETPTRSSLGRRAGAPPKPIIWVSLDRAVTGSAVVAPLAWWFLSEDDNELFRWVLSVLSYVYAIRLKTSHTVGIPIANCNC
ncbi:hypothetical protein RvY_01717-2 [Ramazzottius varieornatus]|uniref:Uncharacterized protein n=1 Tax=Ramazzottius varieornatus TaxID=947166 RepID=A0A1D1UKQ4_RAMVA|nr:hypothetical protein RvY_01717-2 [Ramazzottius varieornatus]